MKNCLLLIVAFVALCVGFSSCSKDKDEDEVLQISLQEIRSQLVGTWEEMGYINGKVYKEEAIFGSDGTFSYSYYKGYFENVKGKWILKDEKTISITDEDGKTTDYYFTYELKKYDKNKISNIHISLMFRNKLFKK